MSTPDAARPWPVELDFDRAGRVLKIAFDTDERVEIPFELLRVESPSAEVQGHGGRDKRLVPAKRLVGVERAEPVGHYAVRIVFDDGHDTGLFTWDYLLKLGRERDRMLEAYASALEAAGLSRDG